MFITFYSLDMAFGPFESGKLLGRDNFIHWIDNLQHYFEEINLQETLTAIQADERRNSQAMEIIRFYMNPSEQAIIAECRTPSQALRRLLARYYPNNVVNQAKIRAEIANTEHDGVGKMDQFLSKLCFHFRELRFSRIMVNHSEIMSTALYKLPSIYLYLVPKLNRCRNIGDFFDLLKEADKGMAKECAIKNMERLYGEWEELQALGCFQWYR